MEEGIHICKNNPATAHTCTDKKFAVHVVRTSDEWTSLLHPYNLNSFMFYTCSLHVRNSVSSNTSAPRALLHDDHLARVRLQAREAFLQRRVPSHLAGHGELLLEVPLQILARCETGGP